jgi:hypothetical protein
MATFTIFDEFIANLGQKLMDMDTDVFKAMLTNVAPDKAANTVKADITEIAAGNGYSAGGVTLAGVTFSETGAGLGIWRWNATSPAWTASGGDIATHRYLVIYDDTVGAPVKPLVGYVDAGASSVIVNGNTRTWSIGASGLMEWDATP